jgi:hypothetical protein
MVGGCYGIVKNTFPDPNDDANCNWKSGNPNFQQAKFPNDQVSVFIFNVVKCYCNCRV